MKCFLVYVTCPDAAEADRIGRALVESRFAACVNILDGMKSIYRWQGKIESANEVVLLAKTTEDRLQPLLARIDSMHPYDTPCAVALPIQAGLPDFLDWVATETRGFPTP